MLSCLEYAIFSAGHSRPGTGWIGMLFQYGTIQDGAPPLSVALAAGWKGIIF